MHFSFYKSALFVFAIIELVKDAKNKGFTEPNPIIDLSGIDVLRKFIISAREGNFVIEKSDVNFESSVPKEILGDSNNDFTAYAEEFYSKLESYEGEFLKQYKVAKEKNHKLRYIARLFRDDKGVVNSSIKLTSIGAEHPFYNIEGSDNAVVIVSEFYPNGIVIKGAGAGAVQTAGGILNDIITL